MAITTTTSEPSFSQPALGSVAGPLVMPVAVQSDWMTVNSAPTATDNATAHVLNPGALTRTAITRLDIKGRATSVLFRMRYDSASVPTTDPVVQVFGFDANDVPIPLQDAAGNHALTCVETAATDVKWTVGATTFGATPYHELDCKGCVYLYFTIKTASAAGAGTEVIQAKLI
jgi:hypothetical protein